MESKPNAKPKTSAAKPALDAKKPGLEVKPVKDLEPDESRSKDVRGGGAAKGGPGRGQIFSDGVLKSQIAPLRDALVNLRELRF